MNDVELGLEESIEESIEGSIEVDNFIILILVIIFWPLTILCIFTICIFGCCVIEDPGRV